jgi:hypothetical protein
MDAIQLEVNAIDQRLAERVCHDSRVKLLMTLPGVSQNVAQSVVAAVGDVNRFESPEKLAAYLGLVPSTRQSATRCYHGGITKRGRVDARWALVQAAHSVRCDLGPLGHFFNKVRRRKNHNIAVCAVARKLAMLAWHLLKTERPYRYAKPDAVAHKLSRLRVAGTGVRRPSGAGKGVNSRTMHAPEERNQKRTPALAEVLTKEGLPTPDAPSPGEMKTLERTGTRTHYESIQRERVRPRKRPTADAPASTSAQGPSSDMPCVPQGSSAIDSADTSGRPPGRRRARKVGGSSSG